MLDFAYEGREITMAIARNPFVYPKIYGRDLIDNYIENLYVPGRRSQLHN